MGVPAFGDANTSCGTKTAVICKKFLGFPVCVDVVTIVACSGGGGSGRIGVPNIAEFNVSTHLINLVGCDVGDDALDFVTDGLTIIPEEIEIGDDPPTPPAPSGPRDE